jgi:hypothetical protein
VPRLTLLFLLGIVLLAPLASAADAPTESVTVRMEASPNLERGTLTVRMRAISRRRFVVKVRFAVHVKKPTRVAVFFNPCRRTEKGYSCLERPLLTRGLDLAEGEEDKSFRATVTRRGREITRRCVGFNAADQNPGGRRAYNIGPKSRSVLCPRRK